MSVDEVEALRAAPRAVTSLDRPVGDEGDAGLGDLLPSDDRSLDEEVEIDLREQTVRSVLSETARARARGRQAAVRAGRRPRPASMATSAAAVAGPHEVARIERAALTELAQRRELAALR